MKPLNRSELHYLKSFKLLCFPPQRTAPLSFPPPREQNFEFSNATTAPTHLFVLSSPLVTASSLTPHARSGVHNASSVGTFNHKLPPLTHAPTQSSNLNIIMGIIYSVIKYKEHQKKKQARLGRQQAAASGNPPYGESATGAQRNGSFQGAGGAGGGVVYSERRNH